MSASTNDRHIPWFNPREMEDGIISALAIGRETLVRDFITLIRQRLESPLPPTAGAHWLVTGTRGAGKSFFLRYAQINIPQAFPSGTVRFVLLPEELPNVRAPHDLLDEIRRMLDMAHGNPGRPAKWRTENPEKSWKESLSNLLSAVPETLLVVGVENFAQLLDKTFADNVAASLLRKLMEHERRIVFLATAVDGSFDDRYDNRLYRQFEKRLLPNWDGAAHRLYLQARAQLIKRKPSPQQLARIDAYSRYTGGNARIAAILAAAILDEQDIVAAGNDLNATVDKMSDYYRALLTALPNNSEMLLDALIRGGEPCSQTQLANRVGASQSEISRAFAKLLQAGYLHALRPKGQKQTHYQVADRLFVQWYRMRYLDPGQGSRLTILAELLADTIAFNDKLRYAERFATQGENDEALLMTDLLYRERGINIEPLRAAGIALTTLLDWGRRLPDGPESLLDLMEMFPSDKAMREAKDAALVLAKNCTRFEKTGSGKTYAELSLGSLSLSPVEKLKVLRAITLISQFQWDELIKVWKEEKKQFATLQSTEGEIIRELEKKRDNEWQHPWLNSWESMRTRLWTEESCTDDEFELIKTAVLALQYVLRAKEENESHPEKFRAFMEAGHDLADSGWTDELLQILERTLNTLPDGPATAVQRARMLSLQAYIYGFKGRAEQELTKAREALALLATHPVPTESNRAKLSAHHREGWALGTLGRWSEALAAHRAARSIEQSAWQTGQTARYLWHLEGLASAWAFLSAQKLKIEALAYAIGQLGDGVCDVQRTEGVPQAYAAGRELLTTLIRYAMDTDSEKKPPLESTVRYTFISMLDTGLDLSVLMDLADDLPSFVPTTDLEHGASLSLLAKILHRWFGELRDPSKADKNAPPPDPDWATSVAALNKELAFPARLRLGLSTAPRLSSDAAKLFLRILAFIK